MNHPARMRILIAAIALTAMVAGRALAQQKTAPAAPAAKQPAAAAKSDTTLKLPRKLAPGVLESVDATRHADETFSRHDVTELVVKDPEFTWAKDAFFRHDVWMLDFKFKPMRMLWVDVPGKEGRMQRKLIWYMVYSVTNPGKIMHPIEGADVASKDVAAKKDGDAAAADQPDKAKPSAEAPEKTFKIETVDKPVRFIPNFSLEVHNRLEGEAPGFAKVYDEKQIPVALGPIQNREDRNRRFLTSAEMAGQEIGVGQTVWGVVTWEDVDPRTVWFSVYVEGLTNAYRWKDDPAKAKAAKSMGAYRSMFGKVLKLNFWRPGDEFSLKENQVRFGAPGQPEYEWIWRKVL